MAINTLPRLYNKQMLYGLEYTYFLPNVTRVTYTTSPLSL